MIRNNLSRGLTSQLQGMNEQQAIATLQKEGRRLKYIILKVWRKYLNDYSPKEYARTRDTQRGIKLGSVRRYDGMHYAIEVTFENDLMYHDSVIGSSEKKGHSFMLISDGWKVKKGTHKNVKNFGYFEGVDLIGQIEKEYNAGRPMGVRLETHWSGKYLK